MQRAAPGRFGPVSQGGADAAGFADDLAASRVVGVQLGVAAPVHGDVQLPGGLVFTEVGTQDVGEEGRQVAVEASAQGPVDGAHQRCVVQGSPGEYFLAVLDAGAREDPAMAGQRQPLAAEPGEAEQHQRVDEGEQVVHLEAQVVGQVGQVGRAVMPAKQDLGQARYAVHRRLRQPGIPECAAAAAAGAGPGRGRSGRAVLLGHHPVDPVDELLELRGAPAAWPGQRIAHVGLDPAGVGAQDEDPVGEQHRFLDVVRDHDHGLGREPLSFPQFQQLAAQVLRGEHVQRAERLVHQQRRRLHDESAGEADTLAHAAGQFLGISRLVAVQAHQVDRAQRPLSPPRGGHPPGLQPDLNVLLHGEPGEQRERLEHHRGVAVGAYQPLAAEENLALGRCDQAGDAPQQGGLAAAAAAEQRDELALIDVQRDAIQHRHRLAVRAGERLAQRLHADQRPGHASAYFDSAMLYSRRHSSAFSPVTYTAMTRMPAMISWKLLLAVAWAMKLPRPRATSTCRL